MEYGFWDSNKLISTGHIQGPFTWTCSFQQKAALEWMKLVTIGASLQLHHFGAVDNVYGPECLVISSLSLYIKTLRKSCKCAGFMIIQM